MEKIGKNSTINSEVSCSLLAHLWQAIWQYLAQRIVHNKGDSVYKIVTYTTKALSIYL